MSAGRCPERAAARSGPDASPTTWDQPTSQRTAAGVDLALHRPTIVPLRPEFEYAVVVLEGMVGVNSRPLLPGKLGYLGRGRDQLRLDVREPARALLLGGEPFDEPIVMWWNFVARSRGEIDDAYLSWARQDARFGRVRSSLPLIPTKAPFWHEGKEQQ